MKTLTAVALLTLVPAASAQVTDGSTWSDGMGTTAHVDVVDSGADSGAGNVTVTDNTGFTDPLSATMTSDSTGANPKAQSSVAGETNSPDPNEYRVKDGKLQKKNKKGKWVTMRRTRKKSNMPGHSGVYGGVDEAGGSLPGGPPVSL